MKKFNGYIKGQPRKLQRIFAGWIEFFFQIFRVIVALFIFGIGIILGLISCFFYPKKIALNLPFAFAYLLEHFTIFLDILCNVTSGNQLEALISKDKRTPLGSGRLTISASLGFANIYNKYNKFGKLFNKALNHFFKEKKHGAWAWEKYKYIKIFKKAIKK